MSDVIDLLKGPFRFKTIEEHTYISDYRMILRIPKNAIDTSICGGMFSVTDQMILELISAAEANIGIEIVLPVKVENPANCPDCKGTGHIKECLSCDGTGESECECCGHEIDCSECDGAGILSSDDGEICDACIGHGEDGEYRVPVTDSKCLMYNHWFILKNILKNVKIFATHREDMVAFTAKLAPDLFNVDGVPIFGLAKLLDKEP